MPVDELQDVVETFQSVEPELRLELLLDYARKLPPLDPRFHAERDAGLGRVPECMTPVFLWIELDDRQRLRMHVDVAEEAPTVQGILSILARGCEGATAAEVASLSDDLVEQLGLGGHLRMNRRAGVAAIIARVKREAAQAVAREKSTQQRSRA
jgi:cysteine desulfuration protein SufE